MFVDVHAHLTHVKFDKDLPEVIKRAKDNNVLIVCAGSGHRDNQRVLRIAKENEGVRASLGLYPWDCVSLTDGEIDLCIDYIKGNAERIICIGEVGLDHHWGKGREDLAKQEWVFSKFLDLSIELDKPVLIHCRQAEHDVLEVLRTFEGKSIIHCYTGPLSLVPEFVSMGCYFSIPASVIKNKSFKKLVKRVPINQLLTETDSPYMAPERGARNEPVNVKLGVGKIAELKGLTLKQAEEELFNNFKRLFKFSIT